MDPRPVDDNSKRVVAVPNQSVFFKYLEIIKKGFKRALGYELLAFLSFFGLLKMIAKG